MTLTELRAMSDEQLLILSKQKNRRGLNSVDAEKAMRVRRERAGYWDDVHMGKCSFMGEEIKYKGNDGFVKKFK